MPSEYNQLHQKAQSLHKQATHAVHSGPARKNVELHGHASEVLNKAHGGVSTQQLKQHVSNLEEHFGNVHGWDTLDDYSANSKPRPPFNRPETPPSNKHNFYKGSMQWHKN